MTVASTCSADLYDISRSKPSSGVPDLKWPRAPKMKIRPLQAAVNKYGKRSLKHLGSIIWDCIDSSLYDLSFYTLKKRYRDNLIATY